VSNDGGESEETRADTERNGEVRESNLQVVEKGINGGRVAVFAYRDLRIFGAVLPALVGLGQGYGRRERGLPRLDRRGGLDRHFSIPSYLEGCLGIMASRLKKPGLTGASCRANMPATMQSNLGFFFYAYFYGAPKAAVASR